MYRFMYTVYSYTYIMRIKNISSRYKGFTPDFKNTKPYYNAE